MKILVAGGTGQLGRHVVRLLRERGDDVAVLTRHLGVAGGMAGDLATGEGIEAACRGMDAVIHLATAGNDAGKRYAVDVEGTRLLAQACAQGAVGHLLYISILGVDRIPMAYYEAKHAAEHRVRDFATDWTVLRLPQFAELLDTLFGALARLPVVPVPRGLSFQPLAARDAAAVVVRTLDAGPRHAVLGAGGPEVVSAKDAAEQWLAARREAGGRGGAVVQLAVPGAVMRAFRDGGNLMPASRQPGEAFGDWARTRFRAPE